MLLSPSQEKFEAVREGNSLEEVRNRKTEERDVEFEHTKLK